MAYIAPCGLNCSECAMYKATQADDQEKLAELAVKWSTETNKWKADDLECDGCLETRVYGGCTECVVRDSAIEKGVQVCTQCSEYACDKLTGLWKQYKLNSETMEANYAKAK